MKESSRLSPAELNSDLPASLVYTLLNPTSYQILGVKCERVKIILYRYFTLCQMLGMFFLGQRGKKIMNRYSFEENDFNQGCSFEANVI